MVVCRRTLAGSGVVSLSNAVAEKKAVHGRVYTSYSKDKHCMKKRKYEKIRRLDERCASSRVSP